MQGRLLGQFPNIYKLTEKMNFAIKKITTLVEQNNIVTTLSVEKPVYNIYGGGIAFQDYYIALSGFPPYLDHIFVSEVARVAKMPNPYEERIEKDCELYMKI